MTPDRVNAWIAWRYTRSARGSGERFLPFITMVSLTGMALGVIALIVVVSVMNGFDAELKRRILGTVPHVVTGEQVPGDTPHLVTQAAFLQRGGMMVSDGDSNSSH